MKSLYTSMSLADFQAMPRKLEWKYEYINGMVHISPLAFHVYASTTIAPCAYSPPRGIGPCTPTAADIDALAKACTIAFENSADYCDYTRIDIMESSVVMLRRFFSGDCGHPVPGFMATGADGAVIGVALVSSYRGYYMLELLCVSPGMQRTGLASYLFRHLVNTLDTTQTTQLVSRYHIANLPSRSWHRKQGFKELPDLRLAEIHYHHAVSELKRLQKIGSMSKAENKRLQCAVNTWREKVDNLRVISKEDGIEAVTPVLKYK